MKLTGTHLGILVIALYFSAQACMANDISIAQIGDDFTLTVVQDGENNSIGGLPGSTTPITGDGNTMTMTQQGDDMVVEGYIYGDDNTITTYQGGSADNSFMRGTVVGNNNTIDARQGKKIDGSVDGNDSGNFEQYLTVLGDDNNVITSQVNSGGTGSGHHMAHIIDGDSNSLSHLQYADGKKNGFIEITGGNNDVELEQRNGASHFTDIVLTGDDHTVYGEQRGGMYGAHSITMDLTNAGGAYNISTIQNSANAQTYSLTGSCATLGGCAVTVTQY
ncbi:hypothetical protein PQZ46_00420 [bacterium]|jgi:hypothetical protein|nr:hypothetical protein [bacterium]